MTFARIHQYLSMATPLLWTRQPDTIGVLGLALNACEERNGAHAEERDQIKELLLVGARRSGACCPSSTTRASSARRARATFRLVHLADILAVTSGA